MRIKSNRLTVGEAEIREVPEGRPPFWIVSQIRDDGRVLLEYCRTVARADRLRLTSVLEYHESEPQEWSAENTPGTAVPSEGGLAEAYGMWSGGIQSLEIAELEPMEARLIDVDPALGLLAFRSTSYDRHAARWSMPAPISGATAAPLACAIKSKE